MPLGLPRFCSCACRNDDGADDGHAWLSLGTYGIHRYFLFVYRKGILCATNLLRSVCAYYLDPGN